MLVNAIEMIETVLPLWDHWCPDDGRPAHVIAAIRAYYADPTPGTAEALFQAAEESGAASRMAHAAWEARQATPNHSEEDLRIIQRAGQAAAVARLVGGIVANPAQPGVRTILDLLYQVTTHLP